jgi:hypothetical protein
VLPSGVGGSPGSWEDQGMPVRSASMSSRLHLPTIEAAAPPPEAGRFAVAIEQARKAGQPAPGIFHLFAWRPRLAKPLCDFMQELMRGDSELSTGQRELIAAWTSARNSCHF